MLASSSTVGPVGGTIGLRAPNKHAFDLRALDLLWPVLAGVALLVFLAMLLQGFSLLGSWTETYEPTGRFTVNECSAPKGRIGTRVECTGDLVPSGGGSITSTLVGPRAAFGSETPRSGEIIDAYYRAGDTSRSFPSEGRSTELARVIAGLAPLVLLVGGLACWIAGWFLTRGHDAADPERRADHYAWPARFALRPRGAAWALLGLGWWVFDRLVVGDVLGAAGLG